MANTTFDVLTGGTSSNHVVSTSVEPSSPGTSSNTVRSPARNRGTGATDELRHWLESSGELLSGPVSVHQVAALVLDLLDRSVPSEQSALLLSEEGSEMLVVSAARGTPMTLAQATWVEQTARESLSRVQVLGRELRDSSLSSFLWIPVLVDGRRVGVIELGDRNGRWLADPGARELSVLADHVGRLLVAVEARGHQKIEIENLKRDLVSVTRECRDQRRQLSASSSQDAIADFAIRIASRAIDPSTYVLSNLQTAREDVTSMQDVIDEFVAAAEPLLQERASVPEFDALSRVVRAAKNNEFQSCFGELEPLIDDVEQGAKALRSIGEDLRELVMGDSAPIDWADVSQLVEQALEVVAQREEQRVDVEMRAADVPPIRCQRLRLVSLFVSLLDHVVGEATPESDVGIEVTQRGANVVVELSLEGARVLPKDARGDRLGISEEIWRLHQETAEDHGGHLEAHVIDELAIVRLSLPTDRD